MADAPTSPPEAADCFSSPSAAEAFSAKHLRLAVGAVSWLPLNGRFADICVYTQITLERGDMDTSQSFVYAGFKQVSVSNNKRGLVFESLTYQSLTYHSHTRRRGGDHHETHAIRAYTSHITHQRSR